MTIKTERPSLGVSASSLHEYELGCVLAHLLPDEYGDVGNL